MLFLRKFFYRFGTIKILGFSPLSWFWLFIVILSQNIYLERAMAADRVLIRKGILTVAVQVDDLQDFEKTGVLPSGLKKITRMLPAEQGNLFLGALRARLPVGVTAFSYLLNTRLAEPILTGLATVIDRQDQAGMVALRAALILGNNQPDGLSLVSFLRAYPSQQVTFNVDQAFVLAANLNASFARSQSIFTSLLPVLEKDLQPTTDLKKFAETLPFDATAPGPHAVMFRQFTWYDQQSDRTLPVDIYYSQAADQNKPLIIFTHGRGSVRSELEYLAEHLASHGYVVVTPEHPGSNENQINTKLTIAPQEFLARPRDINFVIDQLAQMNNTAGEWRGKLGTDNILIIGYSLGGSTALSLAGAEMDLSETEENCQANIMTFSLGEVTQCVAAQLPEDKYDLREPRIKSAIALSPTTSLLFGENGLSKLAVPTLMLFGSEDKTTPAMTEQVIPFLQIPSPRWLVGIIGGTHLSVKDPKLVLNPIGRLETPFSGDEVGGEAATHIRNYLKAITLAMVGKMTPDAEKYNIFFTPEYAQLISLGSEYPITIWQDIPEEVQEVIKSQLTN
ncbi:MAG: alpha/beta hydrolase [Microcoleaceae cyanobacterium]